MGEQAALKSSDWLKASSFPLLHCGSELNYLLPSPRAKWGAVSIKDSGTLLLYHLETFPTGATLFAPTSDSSSNNVRGKSAFRVYTIEVS